MSKNSFKQSTSIGFEVLEMDDNAVVYKRVIPQKHRSSKENNEIELSLPKATLRCFDASDYNKLKIIEQELFKQSEVLKSNKSLYAILYNFLDI